MARLPNPNKLLVEGAEDMRVIPHLIESHGIRWGEPPSEWLVEIKAVGSVDALLHAKSIDTELKERNLKRLGLLVDADVYPDRRWRQVLGACKPHFPELPDEPRPEGTIVDSSNGQRLGIWLMPDNASRGMLETFLSVLVPEDGSSLWAHATQATAAAMQLGAPCKAAHTDKAQIHAWLAWQDPPGRQLHDALIQRILAPASPRALPFVRWFRELYQLA